MDDLDNADEIRNSANTQVAPLIYNFFGNGDSFKKLQEIQDKSDTNQYYNYILKCTDGIFNGKFLYINTTPDGELFGSGDPVELELTMYVESANLSDCHAELKFVNDHKYQLRDCNSETGTWTRIGLPGEAKDYYSLTGYGSDRSCGIDLFQESRLRIFQAGEYQFIFEEHDTKVFHEVSTWLKANDFHKCVPAFEQKMINSM